MTSPRLLRGLAVAAVLVRPLVAAAQQPPTQPAPAQPAPAQPAAPPRIVAGQDGFAVESGNGDYRLQIGLLAHVDGRFSIDDEREQFVDTFLVRRLRPYLRGRLGRRFEFYVNPDFANSTLVVQDAYVDTVFAPAFRLRMGKAKSPFGFERLHSASNMLFMERGMPTAIAPNRDVGVQVLGDVRGGTISYLAGVMNGVADGATADADTNDGKELVGRLVVRPFTRRASASTLRGLGVGFSASRGNATGATALPTLRTQTLQSTYWSYATGATPAVADGVRTRYSPSAWYLHGPFAGWTEYVHSEVPIRRGDAVADVAHSAWQVAGSWVLTGESATDAAAGLRPRNDFDFGRGHWGAFQVTARYHALSVDESAVTWDFGAPGSSRKAEALTLGLRWYLNANLWYTVNFERTGFDRDAAGARRVENGLAFRTQVGF
jgi:phosphate-selective porin OprO/OprP